MLGKDVYEIAIDNMNWEKANVLTKILIEEGYAVLTTLEENLIIINYQYACGVFTEQPNRNDIVFMSTYQYDEKMKEFEKNLLEEYGLF